MSGTWGTYQAQCEAAPLAEASRLIGDGGLIVLAPHPDDETFGASALIVAAARMSRPVGIVALTDGEASHRASKEVPRERLARIRRGEQEAAIKALGVTEVRWLRLALPDGGSSRDERFAPAAGQVAAFCDHVGASVLSAPHPDDPHPDHHAAAALAEAVLVLRPSLRLLYHPIWSMRLATDEPYRNDGLLPFRVATDLDRKAEAIACHCSQLGLVVSDDPDGFSLPEWFLDAQGRVFENHSWACRHGSPPPASHFETLYADDGDPWHVRSSAYERDKRADHLDHLSERRYGRGLDLACGEGHLAASLATSATVGTMIGLDRDASIIERAISCHREIANVSFQVGAMPDHLPDGPFDFAVISEVLYFLNENEIAALAEAVIQHMQCGGDILAVSYLGRTDTPLSGSEAQDLFVACLGARASLISRRERPGYRAELLRIALQGAEASADDGPVRSTEAAVSIDTTFRPRS